MGNVIWEGKTTGCIAPKGSDVPGESIQYFAGSKQRSRESKQYFTQRIQCFV